ncbi:MAG: HAMP domain-containing histidine kinase [Alphaproteobacteria bacterium]|nr:HAMP domain-containing histidine kinase [Alphaproteobacteria bacterium]
MRLYLFLSRSPWPASYVGKFLLCSFLGVHVPMIGAVLYVLAAGNHALYESLGILVALLVSTVVGTAATMGVIYSLLAPVRAAAGAMDHYLVDRALPQLPVRLTDEAGVLMANVQEGLTRLDAALDVARDQVETTTRHARDKFQLLSSLSHELRTPLNHIIGFAEMLSSEALGPLGQARYKDYAGDIGTSGGSLLELLQAVLDLTQTEAGTVESAPDRVSLNYVLHEAVARAHLAAEEREVRVVVRCSGAQWVNADPRLLKQILLHGLSLAIDNAGTGRQLEVTVAPPQMGQVRLELAHGGPDWRLDDVPPELRDGRIGLAPVTTGLSAIAVASPTALRLSLLRSLVLAAGGQLGIGTPSAGGRSVYVDLPNFATSGQRHPETVDPVELVA